MRNVILYFSLLLLNYGAQAQKKAVTETGEEVLLYNDGTWEYANDSIPPNETTEIPLNPTPFNKSTNATFLLKSNKTDFGLWLNPKKWTFKKSVHNAEAEYELQYKDGDLYGMIVAEKIEIPLESLADIAVKNAQRVATDLSIVKKEYRIVNGQKMLCMQMNGTTASIKFSYYGYYYSTPNGSIQFLTYSSQNLMDGYIEVAEDLLNGLHEIK